ncbi:serine/threonine protein kinase [Sporosarcina globispora]|uniref:Serine/threonine protein kinase n=1 Tax=Sporosarcina globispora TaxID=1459 RepID=A0A0M0G7U5_SPOGL|nr:protein kinase [Sporosarcina globispora]KON85858.1 serine/threonine protein kinase [Sporosarcina globispora]
MMNHSLKSQCKVNPGTVIEGKWHRNRYTIIKELGYGANGIVYLAKNQNQQVALKMSDNGMSITSEVNVLKSFAKVQGSALGPSLLDVDDWDRRSGKVSFYVMEYIQGPDLLTFVQQKGQAWTGVLIVQMLKDLDSLHKAGWVFGDLKPDNLIVTGPPPKIRTIDVGGTTIQGRAIKEFTEFYDRGYWGLGTRKADPAYDLFAAAMILINTAYPKRFSKTTGDLKQLKMMVRQKKELMKYEDVILNALQGQYSSADEMRNDMLQLTRSNPAQRSTVNRNAGPAASSQAASRQMYRQKKQKGSFFETLLITFIVTLLYFLYIYGQLL